MLCSNCQRAAIYNKLLGLCSNCARWWYRHKTPRPEQYYNPTPKCKWCKNCGALSNSMRGEICSTCYNYQLRNGKKRPRYLWNTEKTCKTCGKPLMTNDNVKGYCRSCYRYKRRTGQPRPRHLWNIGPHGWCECSWPAITVIDDMPLCKSCAELELSP